MTTSASDAPSRRAAPQRLRAWLPFLRRLPRPMVSAGFAATALAEGVLINGRFSNAARWAGAQGRHGLSRYLLAAHTLVTHGMFVAEEAIPQPFDSTANGPPRVVVEGAEHLAPLKDTGGLLVNFHLGPPHVWPALQASGYPIHRVGVGDTAIDERGWAESLAAGTAITVPLGDAANRVELLYRVRQALHQRALVGMNADGLGRDAFRLDLPGGPLIIRGGWLAIRRATRVATVPVLARANGRQMIVTVHPPLPPPMSTMDEDVEQCRHIFSGLVDDYVRRYPAQCRWLAMAEVAR